MYDDTSWRRHNADSARIWYKVSADMGNADTMGRYGLWYINDVGYEGSTYFDMAVNLSKRAVALDPDLAYPYTDVAYMFEPEIQYL
jgi:hypothetical protein